MGGLEAGFVTGALANTYGFDHCKESGNLVINPEEAAAVREVYTLSEATPQARVPLYGFVWWSSWVNQSLGALAALECFVICSNDSLPETT